MPYGCKNKIVVKIYLCDFPFEKLGQINCTTIRPNMYTIIHETAHFRGSYIEDIPFLPTSKSKSKGNLVQEC